MIIAFVLRKSLRVQHLHYSGKVVRGDQKERAKKERDRLNEKSRGYYLKMEKEMMPDMLGNQSSIL